MKRIVLFLTTLLLVFLPLSTLAEEVILPPQWPVPDYVSWLIDTAEGELGYAEDHGWTKYGEWSGDGYAQWCAEFLCWCVDQVDQQHGTSLLRNVFPLYSGTNTGRNWYINHGRYVARNGHLEDWGYQWLDNSTQFLRPGDYIPQPGDWIFFTWTSNTDTDHVAMVEYCTRNTETDEITIHVIEGNNPSAVQHNTYPLLYNRILGYGIVHDVVHWTLRSGYSGIKVRQVQEKLSHLGYLNAEEVDGIFGTKTIEAIRAFQQSHHLRMSGIANIDTQNALDQADADLAKEDPAMWQVSEISTPLTPDIIPDDFLSF